MRTGTILHLQKVAGIAGSEVYLLSLLPALRERGWDVRLVMLHEREPGAQEFARALSARGVPIHQIPLVADVDAVAFFRLLRHVLRTRPVALHTHLVHADFYGQLAGALANVPLRISMKHGFNEFRELGSFAFADRAVASLAHANIAISRGLAGYLGEVEGFDESSFHIVHYGIAPGPEPPPYPGGARLLCVGRLIPIKGHILLLRAFAAAQREVPELTLDIAGWGPLEPALRALSKELGIAQSVRFLGPIVPIQPAVEDAAIVVLPSLGEGFGMAALEAMERARPVVAASIGGLVDQILHGETGLLVPPGDPDALADAIVELVRDPERAAELGRAGRQRALDRFAEERSIDRIEILYRALLPARLAANARSYTSIVRDVMRSTENSRRARSRPAAPSRRARSGS
jgi:glycosyltransferase involved in cell wall biosynthesis